MAKCAEGKGGNNRKPCNGENRDLCERCWELRGGGAGVAVVINLTEIYNIFSCRACWSDSTWEEKNPILEILLKFCTKSVMETQLLLLCWRLRNVPHYAAGWCSVQILREIRSQKQAVCIFPYSAIQFFVFQFLRNAKQNSGFPSLGFLHRSVPV